MKNATITSHTTATQSDPALLNEFIKLIARSAAEQDFKSYKNTLKRSAPDD